MAPLTLRAPLQVARSGSSSFAAGSLSAAFQRATLAAPAPKAAAPAFRVENLHGQSGRKCMLTGKKANNGYTVSFSHRRTKTLQQPNLQYKSVFWEKEQRWIRLRISTKAMKTIEKVGLDEMADRAGLDLMSLRFSDASPERKAWVAANPGVKASKDPREPKWRPRGNTKKTFIPKWKQAQLDKLAPTEAKTKLEAFKARWG